MSIEALKEQARNYEQSEDWKKALQAYEEAIGRQGDEDQPDLGLYNRAGDLCTRLDDKLGAIGHYERAVELYLESELPNNAIAILKKILRNMPGRSEVYLRIGQIRAGQGFLTDARDNFLKYAEHMQQAGNMEEAFRALSEFAELAPDDVDIRLALAEQFRAHERQDDALDQLVRAHHTLSTRGDVEGAANVAERLREIDPDIVVVEPVPHADAASDLTTVTETSPVEAASSQTVGDIEFEGDFGSVALDDVDADGEAADVAFADEHTDTGFGEEAEHVVQLDDFEPTSAGTAGFTSDEPTVSEDPFATEADGDDLVIETTAIDDPEGVIDDYGVDPDVTALDLDEVDADADDEPESELAIDEPASELAAEPLVSWHDELGAGDPDLDVVVDESDPSEDPADAFVASGPEAGQLDAGPTGDDWEDVVELDLDTGASTADDGSQEDPIVTIDVEPEEIETEVSASPANWDAVDDESEIAAAGSLEAALIDFDAIDAARAAAAEDAHGLPDDDSASPADDEEERILDLDSEHDSDVSRWSADDAAEALPDDGAVAVTADQDAAPFDEPEEWIGVDESVSDDDPELAPDPRGESEQASWAPAFEIEPVEFDAMDEPELREYVTAHPDSGGAWEHLGRLVVGRGAADEASEAFEKAHEAFASARDFHGAMRNVRELLLVDPDSVHHHQRLVEYAHRGDDRTLLVSAFLELGDCLKRTGSPEKSDAVYEKVLEIDPTNRRARTALGLVDSAEASVPDQPAAYVDLGSMILEKREKTTRWTVETEDPTGDEEFDFQDMLRQFRAKVAEHVDVDDVQAHYDLGTAYKEMGLLDEAISEFQQALRADAQSLATYELLGQTFMEKGQPEVAIRTLSRATEMPFDVEDELLGIYYYLGRAHEELGNRDDAVEYYEKVFALDINFEDVTERLRSLR